ncbi:hypothetical protein HMPREF9120_00649 [Neisseria sp. oral taxon 020 str. F0370]|nr:hypothetical protein HMPREF9120_00649 [Neisseria sp. oral taxon 020 str. F0370]
MKLRFQKRHSLVGGNILKSSLQTKGRLKPTEQVSDGLLHPHGR